jgi:hypothetical protein
MRSRGAYGCAAQVDAVFRALPTVHLPGYRRPMIRVEDYLRFIDERTYDGRTKVRPPD